MNQDKDKMHPEDMRNLIVFALVSIAIWFLYETYILGPQTKALNEAKKARAELLIKDPKLMEPVVSRTREEAVLETAAKRIHFSNKEIAGTINLKGGKIDDLSLVHYHETLEKERNVAILRPTGTELSRIIDYGWVTRDKNLRLPGEETQWRIQDNESLSEDLPVILYWDNGQGVRFERHLSIDDQYVITVKQRVVNTSDKSYGMHPYALVSQTGVPKRKSSNFVSYEGPMGAIGGLIEKKSYGHMVKNPNEKFEAAQGWIGFSDKYWLTAVMPQQDRISKYRFKYTRDPVNKLRDKYQTDFTGEEIELNSGATIENTTLIYAGAKKVLTLEAYEDKMRIDGLSNAVDFGWFWFFTYPFFLALHYIGLLVGNMGVAILILTFILRSAVFPLTNISYRSFAKMKVVAPQITEIKERHGDDKEKLQAEIVELYQREGVNPMSGCLPILVQIPIFFAFYKILFTTIEIRHAPFWGWIKDLSAPDPTNMLNLFGFLPYDVPTWLPAIGIWPCIMLIAMLAQKKLNPPPQDATQRMMMNIFPFFITFIMAGFASGLVMYWAFSATLSVIQQSIIMKSMGVPIYFFNKQEYKEIAKKEEEELEKKRAEAKAKREAGENGEDKPSGEDEPVKDIKPPKPKKSKKKKK